jgi:transposase
MAKSGKSGAGAGGRGDARVVGANRAQLSWDLVDPEAWLPTDHPARLVAAFVATLDLSALYDKVQAREGAAGRPAADPAVLFALWLLATIDGVGSARALDRLSDRDLAYRWLRCGVPVNYHGLADFRVVHADVLDDLLTKTLAALLAEGLVDPTEIIVDGTKIRASASAKSFKQRQRLDDAEAEARRRVMTLAAEVESDPAASDRRREAAQLRAAGERADQVAKAKAALDQIDRERRTRAETRPGAAAKQKPAKASLTDPEARRMRFADGAVRAGYNVQLAVTSTGLITAVKTTDRRNDSGLLRPMIEETERRLGLRVTRAVADTGYAAVADIEALATRPRPVTVYAPPPPNKEQRTPASERRQAKLREKEHETVKTWRARMADNTAGGTTETTMKRRKRIELTNAHVKNRGLAELAVRGLAKAQAVVLWHVLALNFTLARHLRAKAQRLALA